MCILLNVKKHEKTFALNVDIFSGGEKEKNVMTKHHLYATINSKHYISVSGTT